jgi:hypothetical protein
LFKRKANLDYVLPLPFVDVQRPKENKEDYSSELREKCAQKEFDRADVVRDVRVAR